MPEPRKRSCLFTLVKWVFLLILLLVAAFVGIGYFVLDGKYELSREITIKAPPEAIHKQVGDLREWPNWLPFIKQDPSVKTTIAEPTGVGASQTWTSDHGNGELKFTASDPSKGAEWDMLFDNKYPSKGAITYAPAGDETRVTWRMTGQNEGIIGKWLAAAMPVMAGPAFEQGLIDLKKKVEK